MGTLHRLRAGTEMYSIQVLRYEPTSWYDEATVYDNIDLEQAADRAEAAAVDHYFSWPAGKVSAAVCLWTAITD